MTYYGKDFFVFCKNKVIILHELVVIMNHDPQKFC